MREEAVVQDNSVKFIIFQETSGFSKKFSASHSCKIKCLLKFQSLQAVIYKPPAEFRHLYRIGDGPKHGQGVTSGNIGSKTNVKPLVKIGSDRRDS